MPPKLIKEGMIQILGQTANSVVYAVADDSKTGRARDSLSVLKGGTVWYRGREALGPGKSAEESDETARKEAEIYEALGKHDRILSFLALEVAAVDEGTEPKAWALRLERAPHGPLRDYIVSSQANPPDERIRLGMAIQFVEGVTHMHRCGVIWGDLTTRNALLFDNCCVKLGDFADSDMLDRYSDDWYGCEITERKVPYGSQVEVPEDEVIAALVDGKLPELTSGNPAEAVIRGCWEYKCESSQRALDDLQRLMRI